MLGHDTYPDANVSNLEWSQVPLLAPRRGHGRRRRPKSVSYGKAPPPPLIPTT